MIATFTGNVKMVSEPQTGTSKDGSRDWTKRVLVLTDADPRFRSTCLAFTFWDENAARLEKLDLKHGELVEVEYALVSEEHKERWMANLTGRRVERLAKRKEERERDLVNNLRNLLRLALVFRNSNFDDKASVKEMLEAVKAVAADADIQPDKCGSILKEADQALEPLRQ